MNFAVKQSMAGLDVVGLEPDSLLDTARDGSVSAWPAGLLRRPVRRSASDLRIAIVHEWLENYAGSERVLEQLLLCYPDADLFAVVDFMNEEERQFLRGRPVQTSFIQRMPFARRLFRNYLGLMPLAIEQLDLSGYDVILSSNHAVAKGVLTGPDQVHISYVHSPMRYAWDLQQQYLVQAGIERGVRSMYARWLFARLRQWDVSSAHHVDHFIANSAYIARRIQKAYRRDAAVIHPPVDVEHFSPGAAREDFYLLACRFVPYKRADIVVEAFAQTPERRLIVVGAGPEEADVRRAGRNASNIEFRGMVPQGELVDLMRRARAFVFAAEEDFGITLVEAQACGTPVIAYGRGGALDIVSTGHEPTGVLFQRQTADAVCEAVDRFETLETTIAPDACRTNAIRFSEARFRAEITDFVDHVLASAY